MIVGSTSSCNTIWDKHIIFRNNEFKFILLKLFFFNFFISGECVFSCIFPTLIQGKIDKIFSEIIYKSECYSDHWFCWDCIVYFTNFTEKIPFRIFCTERKMFDPQTNLFGPLTIFAIASWCSDKFLILKSILTH